MILAAGKGTRLKTELPKVLHEVCGRPMLAYVIDACRQAGVRTCLIVVGYGRERVMEAFQADEGLVWVEQPEQLGTGHAVMVCREQLAGRWEHVLVLCGDGPLIRPETIRELIARHLRDAAVATLATSVLDDPTGYGRILRNAAGEFTGIVEERDCTDEQRAIREVNPSYYCFRTDELLWALERIDNRNAKGEYYITDVFATLLRAGRKVTALPAVPAEDVFSINSRQELALVNRVMRDRVLKRWMDNGVTVIDPATTWIDPRAEIGQDTVIRPFVAVTGRARIGRNCVIGPFTHVQEGMVLGDRVRLEGVARNSG